MKLTKWDPFRDMDDVFGRMNDWPYRGGRELSVLKGDWAPRVDIAEDDQQFTIRAEIPGVERDNIKISIDDRVLTIHGETKRESEEKKETMHRIERFSGSFSRSFTLPDNVDDGAIEASFKDGLLTLVIPKTKVEKKKAVEIPIG